MKGNPYRYSIVEPDVILWYKAPSLEGLNREWDIWTSSRVLPIHCIKINKGDGIAWQLVIDFAAVFFSGWIKILSVRPVFALKKAKWTVERHGGGISWARRAEERQQGRGLVVASAVLQSSSPMPWDPCPAVGWDRASTTQNDSQSRSYPFPDT